MTFNTQPALETLEEVFGVVERLRARLRAAIVGRRIVGPGANLVHAIEKFACPGPQPQ